MRRKKLKNKTDQVEQANTVESLSEEVEELFNVRSGHHRHFRAVVTTNGKSSMEIDTGASISVASKGTFEIIREGMLTLELKETTVKLQTYTGKPIRVRGTTAVQWSTMGKRQHCP